MTTEVDSKALISKREVIEDYTAKGIERSLSQSLDRMAYDKVREFRVKRGRAIAAKVGFEKRERPLSLSGFVTSSI